MPLGSATSKIHSLEGCGIVNMRSWSRTRIISRASASSSLRPLHLSEPSEPCTVILPSVTSLWEAAGLLHKFLTGGEVWQLSGPSEPTWGEFVETHRSKCLNNKKTRRQRSGKDVPSLFPWVMSLPFLTYFHEAKKGKQRAQRQMRIQVFGHAL